MQLRAQPQFSRLARGGVTPLPTQKMGQAVQTDNSFVIAVQDAEIPARAAGLGVGPQITLTLRVHAQLAASA